MVGYNIDKSNKQCLQLLELENDIKELELEMDTNNSNEAQRNLKKKKKSKVPYDII